MMNSGECWLRIAPPEMEEGNLGNCSQSGIAMVVDENEATKSRRMGENLGEKSKWIGMCLLFRNFPILL